MDDEAPVPKPRSKTNQKLRKAPTRPIVQPMDAGALVNEGLSLYKANFQPFAVGVLISLVGNVLIGFLGPLAPLAALPFAAFMGATMFTMALKAHDRQPVSLDDLKAVPPAFVNFLVVSLIVGLAVGVGSMLLFFPGLIAAFFLSLAPGLVVDKGLDPMSAVKRSIEIVKGRAQDLVVPFLAIVVVGALGVIPLGLGTPIALLAFACYYRALT